jgi:hypothetical protein
LEKVNSWAMIALQPSVPNWMFGRSLMLELPFLRGLDLS